MGRTYKQCLAGSIVALSVIALVLVIGTPSDDDLICAAIHPCNDDGSVFAPYDVGPCAERYAAECAQDAKAKAQLSSGYNKCQEENAQLATSLNKANKLIRKLKRRSR